MVEIDLLTLQSHAHVLVTNKCLLHCMLIPKHITAEGAPPCICACLVLRVDSDAIGHGDSLLGGSAAAIASAAPWQPRGALMAHLAEHRRAVTRLAVAGGGAFFVSASADETCKARACLPACIASENAWCKPTQSSLCPVVKEQRCVC